MMGDAMERLSTGIRINSAADDAAGLAITSKMTSQINGLKQAVRNANDAISMVQVAEGATVEITNMLQRMRELAVQAANGANTDSDRAALDKEFRQLSGEIDRITKNTQWNGTNLLDGTGFDNGIANFQVGANADQTVAANLGKLDLSTWKDLQPPKTPVPAGSEIALSYHSSLPPIVLSDGSYIHSHSKSDGRFETAQRFSADGSPIGEEFQFVLSSKGYKYPDATVLPDDTIVTVFQQTVQFDSRSYSSDIIVQRFNADGSALGDEINVIQTSQNIGPKTEDLAKVASLDDGSFVVTWRAQGTQEPNFPDGSGTGVRGRRYSADGQALGSEFQINSNVQLDQEHQAITGLADGGFVVTWQSGSVYASGEDKYSIYAQRYSKDGQPVGEEFRVNTNTEGRQEYPL